MRRPVRVLQELLHDPVDVGDDAVGRREKRRVREHVTHDMRRATARERVAVDEHGSGRDAATGHLDCDRRAERVADDDRLVQVQRLDEALHLVAPALERPRAAAHGVAEAVQIERVDVEAPGEDRPHAVPDERWLDRPAEEHDRAAVAAPLAIGGPVDELPVPELVTGTFASEVARLSRPTLP